MIIPVQIRCDKDALLPTYAHEGDSGFDLVAHNFKRLYQNSNSSFINPEYFGALELRPNDRALIGTGLYMHIPLGFEMQIRPRSGLALKEGITIVNSPGTIDSTYRGEIGIILLNTSRDTVIIIRGDRIAQGVIQEVSFASWIPVDELGETVRNEGGFGHTGK